MRTSFASLEPETPQYLHLFRKCADRWALCSGWLGTFDWLGVKWHPLMDAACRVRRRRVWRQSTHEPTGTSNDRACANQNDVRPRSRVLASMTSSFAR